MVWVGRWGKCVPSCAGLSLSLWLVLEPVRIPLPWWVLGRLRSRRSRREAVVVVSMPEWVVWIGHWAVRVVTHHCGRCKGQSGQYIQVSTTV